MSAPQDEDQTQLEPQVDETQEVDTQTVEDQEMKPAESNPELVAVAETKKRRERRASVELERYPGKSLLPFGRVQKIIKADKQIPIVAKEATFLISLAAEEFIKRLTEAGQQVAQREKRSTVQHRDIATVVRKADEFLFLEEIMPWTSADPPAKRPKPKATGVKVTLLDRFIANKQGEEEDADDVIMNEDGTMDAGNPVEYEQ